MILGLADNFISSFEVYILGSLFHLILENLESESLIL